MKNKYWIPIAVIGFLFSCKKDSKSSIAVIATTAVSNITANAAQSGGQVLDDGGSAISKRGICWALHTNPSLSDSNTSNGTGKGSFTSNLSGLNANTTYYVRAYAINATGTGYGNTDSFTTIKGAPGLTTIPVTGIAPLKAFSGGTIINDGGASVTARGIVWSTTPHPTTANFKTTHDGPATGSLTDSLTDLASETNYYVRAYATNSFGTGYGNEIIFTASSAQTFTDIDGNVYGYITIGTQTWMASNLKVSHYRNGDPIVNGLAVSGFNWSTTTDGAYSFYNGDSTTNEQYGKYYNTLAVNDSRNIAPEGWHIPSDAEWGILEFNQGMSASDTAAPGSRGSIAGKLLVGGSSGLNLQLAGYLFAGDPASYLINYGFYVSSTKVNINDDINPVYWNFIRAFNLDSGNPQQIDKDLGGDAYSVRCVKD